MEIVAPELGTLPVSPQDGPSSARRSLLHNMAGSIKSLPHPDTFMCSPKHKMIL
jgi:hypothetical protein